MDPAASVFSSSSVVVTTFADDGPGSFRDAIMQANADAGIHTVRFRRSGTVQLQSTVTYTGSQNLKIEGTGSTLDGAGTGGIGFASPGGGNLELHNIVVQNAPGTGVFIDVPASRTGTLSVGLRRVTIRNNGLYGLHVDDRADGAFGGADSPAGIDLAVDLSRIEGNNADHTAGVFDFDGGDAVDVDGVTVIGI